MEITDEVLATRWQRFANYLIDLVIQYIFGFIIGVTVTILEEMGIGRAGSWLATMNFLQQFAFGAAVLVLYYFTMEVFTQRSIGKFITGTKVITDEGDKPDSGFIIRRTLCRLIPFEAFSFFGSPGTGWHDTISGTVVVDAKKYEAALNLKNSFEEIGSNQSY